MYLASAPVECSVGVPVSDTRFGRLNTPWSMAVCFGYSQVTARHWAKMLGVMRISAPIATAITR